MTTAEKKLTDDELLDNIHRTLTLLEKRSFNLLDNKQFKFKDIFLTRFPKITQDDRKYTDETIISMNGLILEDGAVFNTKNYKFICTFTSNYVILISSLDNVPDKRLEKGTNTTLIQLLNYIKSIITVDIYKTHYPHFETKQLTSRSANMILDHVGFNKR